LRYRWVEKGADMGSQRAALWCRIWIGVGLCCAITGGAWSGEKADDPPKTLLERMERQMLRYRVHFQNASIKFEGGAHGTQLSSPDPGAQPTPIEVCCTNNVKKMRGATAELLSILSELGRCYETAGDTSAVLALMTAKMDLQGLSKLTEAWARAKNDDEIKGAMGAMTRTYLQLRADVDKLTACVAEGGTDSSPVETEQTAGSND
jgi:hypothetical protein